MNRTLLKTIALLIFGVTYSYSQDYLVTKEKDTVFGSIKMNGRFVLSDKINFISKSGTESNYDPKELIEFKINERTYKNIQIKKKKKLLVKLIDGEISMYSDLKKGQSYLTKDFKEFIAVDKKEKYLKLFKDKPEIYKRIIDNEYKYFEIKSIVKLYNNAPQQRIKLIAINSPLRKVLADFLFALYLLN